MTPREYQISCHDRFAEGRQQFRKQLLVLPTGAGKTIIASKIAESEVAAGGRVLFLAHRQELLLQCIDKFSKSIGVVPALEKADAYAELDAPIVVGSVQTFSSRADRWPADHFSLVIIDEAHHAVSQSYQNILSRFDAHAHVVGITATPHRGDRKNLGKYFENVAYEIGLFDLVNQGFLCPIVIQGVPLPIDLAGVAQTGGDYDAKGIGDALTPYFGAIADAIVKFAAKRKTLIFLPLIDTSKAFTEVCVAKGLRAAHVDGYSENRSKILADFAARKFDVLNNAMLLTEGYDDPEIDCVIVLRPTRSQPLFSQMVGRGTRVFPGKENLLLLDFLWLHERHNLVRPAHLIARNDEEARAMSERAFESVDAAGAQEVLDLQGLASEVRADRERKLAEELKRKASKKGKHVDAQEFFLSLHRGDLAEYEPEMAWESEPASEKQLDILDGLGFARDAIAGKGQASKILNVVFERRKRGLATPKQVKFLRRSGHRSPDTATFQEASAFITLKLKAWK